MSVRRRRGGTDVAEACEEERSSALSWARAEAPVRSASPCIVFLDLERRSDKQAGR
jgi:hypothetical protein